MKVKKLNRQSYAKLYIVLFPAVQKCKKQFFYHLLKLSQTTSFIRCSDNFLVYYSILLFFNNIFKRLLYSLCSILNILLFFL